jgi:hypothetical protein
MHSQSSSPRIPAGRAAKIGNVMPQYCAGNSSAEFDSKDL